jgi:hypothetical protein
MNFVGPALRDRVKQFSMHQRCQPCYFGNTSWRVTCPFSHPVEVERAQYLEGLWADRAAALVGRPSADGFSSTSAVLLTCDGAETAKERQMQKHGDSRTEVLVSPAVPDREIRQSGEDVLKQRIAELEAVMHIGLSMSLADETDLRMKHLTNDITASLQGMQECRVAAVEDSQPVGGGMSSRAAGVFVPCVQLLGNKDKAYEVRGGVGDNELLWAECAAGCSRQEVALGNAGDNVLLCPTVDMMEPVSQEPAASAASCGDYLPSVFPFLFFP